eukprot:TRINITY_DN744_c1_g1_i2.p1 TRINITY_DN744_c1_g1~~TRINITY_DN744_c1_g1_i2.p1  ORF type:complete len:273 (+),score=66.07 TRINITY_DN744_c1_g1_i2:42-821(+)
MTQVIVVPRFLKTIAATTLGGVWFLHYVVDDGIPPSMRVLEIDEERKVVKVPVWISSDFHCPWSLMARRSLEAAARECPEVELEIKWHPMAIHSTLPTVGALHMKAWMDATQPPGLWDWYADPDGVYMSRSRMFDINPAMNPKQLIGSSVNAHRISYHCLKEYGHQTQDRLVQRIFRAFIEEAKDISSPWVLCELAADVGMNRNETLKYLHTSVDQELIEHMCVSSREHPLIKGSPQMNFKCTIEPVTGIQKPEAYAEV